jgi:hypothetical protein
MKTNEPDPLVTPVDLARRIIAAYINSGERLGFLIARKNNNGMSDADICRWLEPIERAYYAARPELMPTELRQSLAGKTDTTKELVTK